MSNQALSYDTLKGMRLLYATIPINTKRYSCVVLNVIHADALRKRSKIDYRLAFKYSMF
jgi:hypothetical protein